MVQLSCITGLLIDFAICEREAMRPIEQPLSLAPYFAFIFLFGPWRYLSCFKSTKISLKISHYMFFSPLSGGEDGTQMHNLQHYLNIRSLIFVFLVMNTAYPQRTDESMHACMTPFKEKIMPALQDYFGASGSQV